MSFKVFNIYGERCSGTNFICKSIIDNFNIYPIDIYHSRHKHFFGHDDDNALIKKSTDVIFICIVRNPIDYLMSFFKCLYFQPTSRSVDFLTFISSEFYSVNVAGEMMCDRNFKNGYKRYRDIFEMRSVKNKFLFSEIPVLTTNYYFMKYENLKSNPGKILIDIKNKFGLAQIDSDFLIESRRILPGLLVDNTPIRENYTVDDSDCKEIIKSRLDFETEALIGYDKDSIMSRLV